MGSIDAGTGIDAGAGSDAGTGVDGGISGPPLDARTGPDAGRGTESGALDQTSFYACAGGGSTTGVGLALPMLIVAGLAIRRRRRSA
jgi:MYXO-CTERM domain-containing protein